MIRKGSDIEKCRYFFLILKLKNETLLDKDKLDYKKNIL